MHVAVDDATRLAYVEVPPDEKATTAIGFLRRAIAFYQRPEAPSSASSPTDESQVARAVLGGILWVGAGD